MLFHLMDGPMLSRWPINLDIKSIPSHLAHAQLVRVLHHFWRRRRRRRSRHGARATRAVSVVLPRRRAHKFFASSRFERREKVKEIGAASFFLLLSLPELDLDLFSSIFFSFFFLRRSLFIITSTVISDRYIEHRVGENKGPLMRIETALFSVFEIVRVKTRGEKERK